MVRIDYQSVAYGGSPGTCSFAIELDATTNRVKLDGLSGITPPTFNLPMFLGISAGLPLATDPGGTTFSVGGPNPRPAGQGMIYRFGTAGGLTPGVNTITFLPNATGGYDWTGQ